MTAATKAEVSTVVQTDAITQLLSAAIDKNISVEALEKLVALHERVAIGQATSEFAVAFSDFKANCPPIPRSKTATVVSRTKGTSFTYDYAPLEEITTSIGPALHARGFSFGWDSEDVRPGFIRGVCILRHRAGHQERAGFTVPVESDAGMNLQQKYEAALSYAQRRALILVLGLTTCDKNADHPESFEPISDSQAHDLQVMQEEVGADRAKFLKYLGVNSFAEIRKSQLNTALSALEEKDKKNRSVR